MINAYMVYLDDWDQCDDGTHDLLFFTITYDKAISKIKEHARKHNIPLTDDDIFYMPTGKCTIITCGSFDYTIEQIVIE